MLSAALLIPHSSFYRNLSSCFGKPAIGWIFGLGLGFQERTGSRDEILVGRKFENSQSIWDGGIDGLVDDC